MAKSIGNSNPKHSRFAFHLSHSDPSIKVRFATIFIQRTYCRVDQPHSPVRFSQFGTKSIVHKASVALLGVHSGARLPSECSVSIAARQPSRMASMRSFQAAAAASSVSCARRSALATP